jgi:hypothetical protein
LPNAASGSLLSAASVMASFLCCNCTIYTVSLLLRPSNRANDN